MVGFGAVRPRFSTVSAITAGFHSLAETGFRQDSILRLAEQVAQVLALRFALDARRHWQRTPHLLASRP